MGAFTCILTEEPLSWDDIIPTDVKEQWLALMEETLLAGDLLFHRSTRPVDALPSEPLLLLDLRTLVS